MSSEVNTHHFHLLPSSLSKSLCPFDLARVALLNKSLVALRAAKPEALAVISDEHHTMPWVAWTRAKETMLDAHLKDSRKY